MESDNEVSNSISENEEEKVEDSIKTQTEIESSDEQISQKDESMSQFENQEQSHSEVDKTPQSRKTNNWISQKKQAEKSQFNDKSPSGGLQNSEDLFDGEESKRLKEGG